MLARLLRDQVLLGDFDFFLHDVAGKVDDFHAVEQWPRDGVELIGRGDEQNFGKIKAHVQVVVQKITVLLRVEHLQQGAGRVTLKTHADFIDFIDHDNRVGGFGLLEALNDFAGHGTDISAAMPLDLGLITHAAHGKTVKLTPEGIGN